MSFVPLIDLNFTAAPQWEIRTRRSFIPQIIRIIVFEPEGGDCVQTYKRLNGKSN